MIYKYAAGYNNIVGLQAFDPQPRCPGIQPARIVTGGNSLDYEDGKPTAELIFSVATAAQYNNLLTDLGLLTAQSGRFTIEMPANEDRDAEQYNATISRPKRFDYQFWWKNVVFTVTIQGVAS